MRTFDVKTNVEWFGSTCSKQDVEQEKNDFAIELQILKIFATQATIRMLWWVKSIAYSMKNVRFFSSLFS